MDFIIPVGGKGERFRRQGQADGNVPKHMIRMAGQEMIAHLLERLLRQCTQRDRIFIVHRIRSERDIPELIKERGARWQDRIHLIPLDRQTAGAAETVLHGLERMDQDDRPVALMDCDAFYLEDPIMRVRRHVTGNRHALVCFRQPSDDPFTGYSYVTLDGEKKRVTDIREKERVSEWANTGLCGFGSRALLHRYAVETIRSNVRMANDEFYVSGIIRTMLENGQEFTALEIPKRWMVSLGTPEQVHEFESCAHAFLFDLDGTLVQTDHIYESVWHRLLSESLAFQCTPEMYRDHVCGNDDATALRKLFPDITDAQIAELSERKDRLFLERIDEVRSVKGAVDFVRQVADDTLHRLAIVTNCNRTVATRLIDSLGLTSYVHTLVIGNECERPKPYPDPYRRALEELGIPCQRAIVFEDSGSGMLSAQGVFPKCIVQLAAQGQGPHEYATVTVPDFTSLDIDRLLCNSEKNLQRLESLILDSVPDCVRVHLHEEKLKGGFIADVVAVDLFFQDGRSIECVIKLQNRNTQTKLARMALMLGLYEREYCFYEHVRPILPTMVHAPQCHGIVRDTDGTRQGILLERLSLPEYRINLDLDREDIGVSLTVIRRMAQLHGHFVGDRACNVSGLKRNDDPMFRPVWTEFIRERWPRFREKWGHMLTGDQLSLAGSIVDEFDAIQLRLSRGATLTLIHGDIKSANIFYRLPSSSSSSATDNHLIEPYFIDWQYICHGKGAQDLAFFMIESFSTGTLVRHFKEFKRHYYETFLSSSGIWPQRYPFSEFESELRDAAMYYPFFVAIWFGTLETEDLIDADFPRAYISKLFGFYSLLSLERNQ